MFLQAEIIAPKSSAEKRRILALQYARAVASQRCFFEQTKSKEVLVREHALFQGRFQPPSIAHLSTVKTILNEWKNVTIGIVYNSPRPDNLDLRLQEYLDKVDVRSYGPGKNPFTREEVMEMWVRCLEAEGLADRVTCVFIKRQEFETDFEILYPSDKIDLVLPESASGDTETDKLRREIYAIVYTRKIFYVKPPVQIHNSKIREIIASGRGNWAQFIPPGAYETFLEMEGPRRIDEAEKLMEKENETQ